MKPPKKKRLGSGRVAFIARVGPIKERIDAGYTMASIYEDYQRDLGIGYKQFVNYVNKFIRDKRTTEKEKEKPETFVSAGGAAKPREKENIGAEDSIVEWKENPDIPDEDLF